MLTDELVAHPVRTAAPEVVNAGSAVLAALPAVEFRALAVLLLHLVQLTGVGAALHTPRRQEAVSHRGDSRLAIPDQLGGGSMPFGDLFAVQTTGLPELPTRHRHHLVVGETEQHADAPATHIMYL